MTVKRIIVNKKDWLAKYGHCTSLQDLVSAGTYSKSIRSGYDTKLARGIKPWTPKPSQFNIYEPND